MHLLTVPARVLPDQCPLPAIRNSMKRLFKAEHVWFIYNDDFSGDVFIHTKHDYIESSPAVVIPYSALMKFMIHPPAESREIDENGKIKEDDPRPTV